MLAAITVQGRDTLECVAMQRLRPYVPGFSRVALLGLMYLALIECYAYA